MSSSNGLIVILKYLNTFWDLILFVINMTRYNYRNENTLVILVMFKHLKESWDQKVWEAVIINQLEKTSFGLNSSSISPGKEGKEGR